MHHYILSGQSFRPPVYIQDDIVNVMELYDEREDFARALFGIVITTQETLDYWNE